MVYYFPRNRKVIWFFFRRTNVQLVLFLWPYSIFILHSVNILLDRIFICKWCCASSKYVLAYVHSLVTSSNCWMLGGNLKDFLSPVLTGGVILLWFQCDLQMLLVHCTWGMQCLWLLRFGTELKLIDLWPELSFAFPIHHIRITQQLLSHRSARVFGNGVADFPSLNNLSQK